MLIFNLKCNLQSDLGEYLHVCLLNYIKYLLTVHCIHFLFRHQIISNAACSVYATGYNHLMQSYDSGPLHDLRPTRTCRLPLIIACVISKKNPWTKEYKLKIHFLVSLVLL